LIDLARKRVTLYKQRERSISNLAKMEVVVAQAKAGKSEQVVKAREADLQAGIAELELHQKSLDRLRQLFDRKAIDRGEVNKADITLKVAKARVEGLDARADAARFAVEQQKLATNHAKESRVFREVEAQIEILNAKVQLVRLEAELAQRNSRQGKKGDVPDDSAADDQ
jgi:multidrug resistance efflux pump